MKVVFASRNKNKIREFNAILASNGLDVEVLSLDDIGFYGEIEEDGKTFEENATIKASVPAKLGYIGIADDSGLCVDALDGRPGVYSARYAGEPCNDENNNKKLLSELKDVPDEQRTAHYVSVISCVLPGETKPVITAEGRCSGIILHEYRGNGGFGYDPLFYYKELGKTLAEITREEKNNISHRGYAVREFCEKFKKYIENK